MKVLKLLINTALRGLNEKSIVSVNADENGVILDKYWRRRLKDAAIDNCVEIIEEQKEFKKQTNKSE